MGIKFKGLPECTPAIKPSEQFYKGDPCLHLKHSSGAGDINVWRDTSNHACMECVQEIQEGSIGLDLSRFSEVVKRKAYTFWDKVDIGEWDECWRWTAPNIKNHVYYMWKRQNIKSTYCFHPILVMNWLVFGDTGRKGTITLCGERRCMNPLHNFPKGVFDKDELPKYDKQYLDNQKSLLKKQLSDWFKPELKDPDEYHLIKEGEAEELPHHLKIMEESMKTFDGISPIHLAMGETMEQMLKGNHPSLKSK